MTSLLASSASTTAKQTVLLLCCYSTPMAFVGLKNPDDKYRGTRHNVGFEMIDALATSVGIPMDTVHYKGLFGKGFVGDIPIFLAKPQTYMNEW
ncbi:hypothetical protein HN51_069341 [Arachis hypogaea]